MINYKELFYDNDRLNKNKLKRGWIEINDADLYSKLLLFENKISIDIEKYSQLIWHYNNNMLDYPKCDHCGSDNRRFYGLESGYKIGCNKHCAIQITRPSSNETRRKNTLEKWGVDHTTKLESTKAKMKETNLIKFGVEYASQNETIKDKIKTTNIDRYGYDSPLKNPLIKENMISNFLSKWGVSNPSKSIEVKESIKKSNLEKWGVEWSISNTDIKEKIRKTVNLNFYNKIYDIYKDSETIKLISYENNILKFSCNKCNKNFDINPNLLHQRYYKNDIDICLNCNPLNNKTSNSHLEIVDYLKHIGIKNIIINDRSSIKPYEIDILLPDYNIGIEFNGVYWHSELVKDKRYHFNKRKKCVENNIELIQIWEDDWNYKNCIIKSILSNRLGKNINIIWARKCKIELVSDKLSKEFLNKNHIQGWSVSKWRFGLFYENELVSLITFSKGRKNMNSDKDEYELVRFCNKLNHNVVGGLSKLWSHFIKLENPDFIISYCDLDLFNGNVYLKLGMILNGNSINYYWCDGRIRWNRWNFRKDKLVREGFDKDKSEFDIMMSRGWYRCWGSGNNKYIWNNLKKYLVVVK